MPRHAWDLYDTPHTAIQKLIDMYPFIQGQSLLDSCAGDGRIPRAFIAAQRFSFIQNAKTDFVPTWRFIWVRGQRGTVQVVSNSRRKVQQLPLPILSSS